MKVVISVGGKFHAFYLARELLKRNCLERLITSYPKFEVVKYGIPKEKIKSIVIKEILWRTWSKLPFFIRKNYDPTLFTSDIFDRWAARKLIPTDIFTGWSSFSLYSMRKVKAMGVVTVLDHGSAHIEYHDKILREEQKIWGIPPGKSRTAHPGIVKKEIREYEEADFICIPSLFSRRTFLEAGVPAEKIIRIPYGVDLDDFRPGKKTDKIFRVVYAGGMTLQKGVHYLLRAFSELKLPSSELLLIGGLSEEIEPFFKKYAGNFRYLGIRPQKELTDHYVQSSVFVLNSIHDGFGMVIIQAMASGLPVIATQNTGGPDIIEEGKTGFIIPIRDVQKLKERLVFLYENEKIRAEMGKQAAKRAASGFSWDDYGNNIVKAYEGLLEMKKGKGK